MIEFFNNWYMALSGFEKTLWMIAIPTTIIFAFQMIIVFFGLDIDGADDIDTDVDDDHSFGWFSFKNLINFLVIFFMVRYCMYR